MAHVPLFQHANPKRVLILGGGDGYILSEVLKHATVEHVDHVDLDEQVIETCKKFFKWGSAWSDPRVHLHIEDGAKFVERTEPGFYDVVIQDSSDPWTSNEKGETIPLPSGSLYVPKHYSNIFRALAQDGILNFQVSQERSRRPFTRIRWVCATTHSLWLFGHWYSGRNYANSNWFCRGSGMEEKYLKKWIQSSSIWYHYNPHVSDRTDRFHALWKRCKRSNQCRTKVPYHGGKWDEDFLLSSSSSAKASQYVSMCVIPS